MPTNTVPSYLEFVYSSQKFISQNYLWLKNNYNFPTDTITDLKTCLSRISSNEIMIMVCLAIVWTVMRYTATQYLFEVIKKLSYNMLLSIPIE